MSMLTAFKLPLASKCVLYIPKHKTNEGRLRWNFEVLGMQRWDKSTDRAQRVDEKILLKCLKNAENHVYFQSYSYWNVKHCSFCSFCW